MLSNTAVPKYYGAFREKVLRGEIPVNQEISMQMNRIDARIRDPRYYYDGSVVEGFKRYCESELTLTDGGDLYLLDSFLLWAEDLLGWYEFIDKSVYVRGRDGSPGRFVNKKVKQRLTTKQYLIMARGGSKSMYDSCIQSYFLNVDTSTTHQVTLAPTMKQAEEILSPIRTSITRARGPLFKFLTNGSLQNTTGNRINRVKLASTKKGIENFLTGSLLEIRPMSIDKIQGLRCKCSTVDEWLSGDTREDPIAALEQGAAKGGVDDYIIVATSSEGTVRDGIGDEIKMELYKILRGEYNNPHVSIWYYRLDDISEVAKPEMWIKANPNIGITVTYEIYKQDVERAEASPSNRNDILAKRFGIPMQGFTYFFTYEETLLHRQRDYYGMLCAMGGDMSQGDDFCSFSFLFPLNDGSFGVRTRNYITELTYSRLPQVTREKYNYFMQEGSLVVMDGTVLDMMNIYDDLDRYIVENDFTVICFGFDPYNSRAFVERWCSENGQFGVEKVVQGFKTESVPLGEIKKLAEERMLIFDQEIMKFCMGHCIALEDTNGNRKLYKKRREEKIDCVAATMDAYVAYKLNPEGFE